MLRCKRWWVNLVYADLQVLILGSTYLEWVHLRDLKAKLCYNYCNPYQVRWICSTCLRVCCRNIFGDLACFGRSNFGSESQHNFLSICQTQAFFSQVNTYPATGFALSLWTLLFSVSLLAGNYVLFGCIRVSPFPCQAMGIGAYDVGGLLFQSHPQVYINGCFWFP